MIKNKKNKKAKKGFTLIELVIVIAILGILAMIAVPKFSGILSDSKKNADDANLSTISSTLSTLVAQDKLDYSSAITVTFESTGVSASPAGSKTPNNDAVVKDAFNNKPVPKQSGVSKFTATIDTNGKVSVIATN